MRLVVASAAAGLVLVLAACGGGGGTTPSTNSSPAKSTAAAPAASTTPAGASSGAAAGAAGASADALGKAADKCGATGTVEQGVLTLTTEGKNNSSQWTPKDAACVLTALKAPADFAAKVADPQPVSSPVTASWGGYQGSYTFSQADGLTLKIKLG